MLCVVIGEEDTLLAYPVDVGCGAAHQAAVIGAHVVDTNIVTPDDENVRTGRIRHVALPFEPSKTEDYPKTSGILRRPWESGNSPLDLEICGKGWLACPGNELGKSDKVFEGLSSLTDSRN